jgi:hypothetical protein
VNRPITRGQLRDPLWAGASAQEIAAEVVAPAKAAGVSNLRASVASADPSPRTAVSRSSASSGQVSGTRNGLNWETSRSL